MLRAILFRYFNPSVEVSYSIDLVFAAPWALHVSVAKGSAVSLDYPALDDGVAVADHRQNASFSGYSGAGGSTPHAPR